MPKKRPMLVSVILTVLLASSAVAAEKPITRIHWEEDMLTVTAPAIPGAALRIWYLEALCRSNSTDRPWDETCIGHETRPINVSSDGQRIELQTRANDGVVIDHTLAIVEDGVVFQLDFHNPTDIRSDLTWAQPCLRVETFTGLVQETYPDRCFIFTDDGRRFLNELPRTEEARYLGGQVYVPVGVRRDDVNPRPISPVAPAAPLIGCISSDGQWVVAMAWDQVQELFQGVITCIHADLAVGGLAPGERKTRRGKLYLLPADASVLERYHRDFTGPNPAIKKD